MSLVIPLFAMLFKKSVDVAIIGSGVSGLTMAARLRLNRFQGSVLIVDSRSEAAITAEADDVPYYFNRKVDIPGLNLCPTEMLLDIWWGGRFHIRPDATMSSAYAQKIVGQQCPTTIDFIRGTRTIFVPPQSEEVGRRHTFIAKLMARRDAIMHFGATVETIDLSAKLLRLSNGQRVGYGALVSTISLPYVLSAITPRIPFSLDLKGRPFFMVLCWQQLPARYRATYCPDPMVTFNRVATLGKRIFIEAPCKFSLDSLSLEDRELLRELSLRVTQQIVESKWIRPGRMVGLEASKLERLKAFFSLYDTYLLGRYATWTFKLTEDVWDDSATIAARIGASSDQ